MVRRRRERLAISSAGIGGMQDLLATMNEATLRGQVAPNELSYVAPELLMGNAADQRADVFTIGALMYYMATGRPPYVAESFPQLLGRMLDDQANRRGERAAGSGSRGRRHDHALYHRGRAAAVRNRRRRVKGVAHGRPHGCAVVISRKSPVARRNATAPHVCLPVHVRLCVFALRSTYPECGTSSGRSRCSSTQSPFSSSASWPSSRSRAMPAPMSPASNCSPGGLRGIEQLTHPTELFRVLRPRHLLVVAMTKAGSHRECHDGNHDHAVNPRVFDPVLDRLEFVHRDEQRQGQHQRQQHRQGDAALAPATRFPLLGFERGLFTPRLGRQVVALLADPVPGHDAQPRGTGRRPVPREFRTPVTPRPRPGARSGSIPARRAALRR